MKVEAGYALDLEVARNVMDQKILTKEEMVAEAKERWKVQPLCRIFFEFTAFPNEDGTIAVQQKCPSYSTSIEDAWAVRDRIDCLMRLEGGGPYGWACEFLAVQPGQEDVIAKAETAPLAICIAALLVVQQRVISKD